jgi:polyhydroxyalkanoate synthesis repressor PhaR
LTKNNVIVIKKYPNRRLYDTEASKYITLEDLAHMVKQEKDFKVIDIKSNEDITRITLAQIILDHEMKGYELLPMDVLKHIIKLYDHPMNRTFSDYIMHSVKHWNNQMDQFKDHLNPMQVPYTPQDWQNVMEEFSKQNQKFFAGIMKNFSGKK